MSRYRGPRLKMIRRLGTLMGLTQQIPKSVSNQNISLSKKKMSSYRVRLQEKQKLRFYYGMTEKQLLNYMRVARKQKGSTGQTLLQMLEMRLDNTIYRLGFSETIPAARQLVCHRHILINGHIVNIPSYGCKIKDTVQVKNNAASIKCIERALENRGDKKVPNHLELDIANKKAVVTKLIDQNEIGIEINQLLVVEYYSRQA